MAPSQDASDHQGLWTIFSRESRHKPLFFTLVGGGFNQPMNEKYANVKIGIMNPQVSRGENSKNIWVATSQLTPFTTGSLGAKPAFQAPRKF